MDHVSRMATRVSRFQHSGHWQREFKDAQHAAPADANMSLPKRVRCQLRLPKPEWFQQRVARLSGRGGQNASNVTIRALAKVQVASVWENILTYLNEEEFVGFEFFLCPADFFSLRILSVFPLQEGGVPVPASKAMALRPRRPDGVVQQTADASFTVQRSSLTQPCLPYLPGVDLSSVRVCVGGRGSAAASIASAQQVLTEVWGLDGPLESCLVIPMPETLLQLALDGLWTHIPCLGRWHGLLTQLPDDIQMRVGWPGKHAPKAENGAISGGRILDLVKKLQSWAPVLLREDDENHQREIELSSAVQWLLDVRAGLPQDGMPTGKYIYSSLFLVRCLLMSRLLPAYVSWKQLCMDALTLLFPNLLRDAVPRLLENKHLFPSEGSKHKIRLVLDVALLLWQRKRQEREGACVRFAGADSSPQHGKNWLLSSCVSVRQDKIVEVFRCLQRMIFDCLRRSSDYDPEQQSEQSRADHTTVHAHVQQEHELPVVLGSGAETTGHKCAAMLHKWAVLVGHSDKLPDYLGSFFSFCSDMGVELGIGHFHVEDSMSLLPPWLKHSSMEVDLPDNAALPGNAHQVNLESDLQEVPDPQPEVSEVAGHVPGPAQAQENLDSVANWKWQPQPRPDTSSSLFLPHAVVVAGLLHIVNNALCEVSGQLAHFEVFFEQLGEFEGLVTCGRLVRFVNYCVRPSHLAHKADDLLQRKFGRLYLKRWGEVVKFCRRLSEFLPLIRCVWDQRAYLHGAAAEEEGGRNATRFSPERFSNILKDHMFFAYFDMVLKLSDAIEQLAHWAESCPCHEDFQMQPDLRAFNPRGRRDAQAHFRHGVRAVRSMYQGRCETCVMRGKRLPELVAEGLDLMLARLSDLAYVQLLQVHRPLLSDEEWASLVSDFEKGKAHAQLEFSLKLDFLRRLPWKLALLAHHDQAQARRELQVTVREFDAQSPELQQHHHSLVLHMLGRSGDLRADFDKCLAGQSLDELPKLEFFAACFRLVQVTERSYEASHSIVKRKVPPNAAGPIVSLSLRLHDFARAVRMQESVLQDVASEFGLARHVLRIPGLVGLAAHPDIVQHRKHSWSVVKHMNRVLYRADVLSQFPEVSHLDAFDKKDKDRQQRVAQKLMPKSEDLPLTYDNLRAKALHAHFLNVAEACPQAMFALPHGSSTGRKVTLQVQGCLSCIPYMPGLRCLT